MDLVGSNATDVAPIEVVVLRKVRAANISKRFHPLRHIAHVAMLGHLDQKVDFRLRGETGDGGAADMVDRDERICEYAADALLLGEKQIGPSRIID